MNPYVYIVIRKDIKPCHYAPQLCHAALEAGYQSSEPKDLGKTHIIVLQVKDKIELKRISEGLWQEGIAFEEFHESYKNLGFTSLATLPMMKPAIGWLKDLELFNY